MRAPFPLTLVAMLFLAAAAGTANAASSFTEFETGQVRPLAQSPDGSRLFAINTPDNRLEIFDIGAGALTKVGSVPVGLEPIAVAARTNGEVWVVNHLSDSISIVDVSTPASARVVRTLLVGDEPRDLVFAGPGGTRAFVTTAHRGQNTPLQADDLDRAQHAGDRTRRRLGLRRDQSRRRPRRHAGDDRHPLRRYAPGARGQPGRDPRLRRRLPLRQPDDHDRRRLRDQRRLRRVGSARLQRPSRRPARAEQERREHHGTRGRPDRQIRRRALARRARTLLGRGGQVRAPRQGRVRDRRDHQSAGAGRRPERVRERRRHDPLQHGREPGQRKDLRLEPRLLQSRPLRGCGSDLRGLQAAG